MQVCHGKAGPLRRIRPGDGIAYYSPTIAFGSRVPYRAFTACGTVRDGDPYPFDMGGGFRPWRRDVVWNSMLEVSIAPMLPSLGFSAGKANWGQQLRFGLLAISPDDFSLIAAAMSST